ncbi:GtrA family protein [Streptomyces luteireticuli]|uniref:GtrA family protein n=1 Tax=Streptomyces luteireticuli TaxID=173858 RepID=UPI0035590F4A
MPLRQVKARGSRPHSPSGLLALGREFAKFGTVGGIGIFVNFGVFNLCRGITRLPVVRCSVIATVVAIAFNYLGLRYFTYRDRRRGAPGREVALFAAFSAAGLVIENGVLYVATYAFDWNTPFQNNAFKFLGIGTATLFRFWAYRAWVFRTGPGRGPRPAPCHDAPAGHPGDPAAYRPETTAPPP